MPERLLYSELENGDIIAVYKATEVKPKDKRAHERQITKLCLQDLLGVEQVVLSREESGAPFLVDFDQDISLSHSGPWYAFHLAKNHHAGIDIQVLRKRGLIRASGYFVSEREKHLDLTELNLHLIWCAKEAIYKYAKGNLKDDRESAVVKSISSDKIIMDFEGDEIVCDYLLEENFALVFKHN